MARSFSSKQAMRAVEQVHSVQSRLEESDRICKKWKNNVEQAAKSLIGKQTLRQLKEVPIEEINRDRSGIRVKLLRDSGYETVADIAGASVYNIAAVRGIGEDSARVIYDKVRSLADQAGRGVKIRLSTDSKTEENTQLVNAISKYRKIRPCAEKNRKLYAEYAQDFHNALEDIVPATSTLRWLFTSHARRREAERAYAYLTDMLASDYITEAEENLGAIDAALEPDAENAWQDFADNSILFFNILEELVPGALGTDDAVYGLPEELAREIQDEEFLAAGLKCTLRRYQEWGVKYILHQERVLLGDEMGLGKTVQAIAAMVSLQNTGATHFMVVCPASVLSNWCREIRRHSSLRVTKIHGQDRMEALYSWLRTGGAAVTTYETTRFLKLAEEFRFSMLIVDEAHYIKNPHAQRTIYTNLLGCHADRMLYMTGTALENNVDEMISLIRDLQPRVADEITGLKLLPYAPQFREKIAPVYYRRKREDVLTELPELTESLEWCRLSGEEEVLYENAVLNGDTMELRRVSWNVPDLRQSCKAARMLELIREAEEDGRKVIVFSFFLDTISKVSALLGDRCLQPINGSVPPQRRQEIIDEFEKAPAGTVLAAQIQSGGTGLNIQTASVVILCEPQLKPSVENQAISRVYRMGQTRNVLVFRLLCEDTVDERMIGMLEEKQQLFDEFADKSVAAAAEKTEIDETSFGNIIREEIDRINAKRTLDEDHTAL